MTPTYYLAVDLGAESGRVMLGTLDGEKLSLQEIHRFANKSGVRAGHLRWDLAQLEAAIAMGLEKAAGLRLPIAGVSTDSWGVDYVLCNSKGEALSEPVCYRDSRTDKSPERLFQKLPFAGIYAETGIQFMAINTLFQLEAEQSQNATGLSQASRFLLIADYLNARLCGVEVAEQSLASTTQIYDPRSGTWSEKLTALLGLKSSFFPRVVPSGTVLGPVSGALKTHEAFHATQVVATCSHDTGAAVAAVPADGRKPWAYLSSGTWSLLGAELDSPVMTDAAREAGFTNEVGLGGKIRFLKNIAGLWVVQECRRSWESLGQVFSYDDLTRLAVESGPATVHISLQDTRFLSPGDMPEKIAAFCRETGQPVPTTPGEIVRSVLESLALTYAQTLRQLESLVGYRIEQLHIVGGGSRNDLLNQLTADATGLTVITGPVEATAIGNILIQALALGDLTSVAQVRRIAGNAFPTRTFQPTAGFSGEVRARFQ